MLKHLLAVVACVAVSSTALAADVVKIGMLQGFTGPTESLVGPMVKGGELAIEEVSDSGLFLGGKKVVSVHGDGHCVDAAAGVSEGERLITAEGVVGINGPTCSGVTTAVVKNVVRPNGIVTISPSATSPALTTIEDGGYFFRTAPSDARQGEVIAHIMIDHDIDSAAITYTNNDYGKGLADSIEHWYEELGGNVTAIAAHEDGKADYSAEVAALAAAGGEVLVVAGYLDQGGKGMIQASLDTGAFDRFILPDGMVGEALTDHFGDALDGSIGINPGTDSPGADMLAKLTKDLGVSGSDPYLPECYDASALLLLSMQAAGTTDSAVYKDSVMDVANAPGTKIFPGELKKGLQILADGGDIDYVGGSAVEFKEPGEAAGSYRETVIEDGKWVTVGYH